jgi:hypothetical protein
MSSCSIGGFRYFGGTSDISDLPVIVTGSFLLEVDASLRKGGKCLGSSE